MKIVKKLLLATILLTPLTAFPNSISVKAEPPAMQRFDEIIEAFGTLSFNQKELKNISVPIGSKIVSIFVTTGESVKKGKALFSYRLQPQEPLNLKQAKSAFELAKKELDSSESLYQESMITESQLQLAKKRYEDAKNTIDMLKAQGAQDVDIIVKAPFDAVVTQVLASGADNVLANQNILSLAPANSLKATLGIEPEDAQKVKPKMKVFIESVFDKNAKIEAVVDSVSKIINPQTRLIDVIVLFRSQNPSFAPGAQVKSKIYASGQKYWSVPKTAVLRDKDGDYIFQIKNGVAIRQNVIVQAKSENRVAISSPINPDLKVITSGCYELRGNEKVSVQK